MDLKQLTEQMLGKKLQELNNNGDQFVKWCAEIILLDDAQQLAMLEAFRTEYQGYMQAQKDALEAEKIRAETELTKHINALTSLDGKVEKIPVGEKQ